MPRPRTGQVPTGLCCDDCPPLSHPFGEWLNADEWFWPISASSGATVRVNLIPDPELPHQGDQSSPEEHQGTLTGWEAGIDGGSATEASFPGPAPWGVGKGGRRDGAAS